MSGLEFPDDGNWTPRRKRAFSLAFDLGRVMETTRDIVATPVEQIHRRSRLNSQRGRELDDLARSVERFFISAGNPEAEHPGEWT